MKTKKIYILLTRFPDNGSKAIEALTGCYYPHTSIGLEEDLKRLPGMKLNYQGNLEAMMEHLKRIPSLA